MLVKESGIWNSLPDDVNLLQLFKTGVNAYYLQKMIKGESWVKVFCILVKNVQLNKQ